MYYARLNVTASVAFARRLLCRLPAPRTSYCRTLSQAKNLIEDVKSGSSSLSYKDYALETAGVPRDEFKKRFQACRSVDEVLHLVFSEDDSRPVKPQDLVASAEALGEDTVPHPEQLSVGLQRCQRHVAGPGVRKLGHGRHVSLPPSPPVIYSPSTRDRKRRGMFHSRGNGAPPGRSAQAVRPQEPRRARKTTRTLHRGK
ncbi:hypothetical protein MTO96_049622 [Rhipicephalus appendiculatus]